MSSIKTLADKAIRVTGTGPASGGQPRLLRPVRGQDWCAALKSGSAAADEAAEGPDPA